MGDRSGEDIPAARAESFKRQRLREGAAAMMQPPVLPHCITRAGWYDLGRGAVLGYFPRALEHLSRLLPALNALPWEVCACEQGDSGRTTEHQSLHTAAASRARRMQAPPSHARPRSPPHAPPPPPPSHTPPPSNARSSSWAAAWHSPARPASTPTQKTSSTPTRG
jgi:hypothetical protein